MDDDGDSDGDHDGDGDGDGEWMIALNSHLLK